MIAIVNVGTFASAYSYSVGSVFDSLRISYCNTMSVILAKQLRVIQENMKKLIDGKYVGAEGKKLPFSNQKE